MRAPRTASWAPGKRFALVAIALTLFGLLSMHGWGSHAGGHTMTITPVAGLSVVAPGHQTVHAGMAPDSAARSGAQTAPAGGHGQHDGDPGESLLGLCLAVLAGLLLGIALLLARHGVRTPRRLVPTWQHPLFLHRDRDPPDLIQLRVIRC